MKKMQGKRRKTTARKGQQGKQQRKLKGRSLKKVTGGSSYEANIRAMRAARDAAMRLYND